MRKNEQYVYTKTGFAPGASDVLSEQILKLKSIFNKYIILYDYNRQMSSHGPTDVVSHGQMSFHIVSHKDKCRLTHRQMSSHKQTD